MLYGVAVGLALGASVATLGGVILLKREGWIEILPFGALSWALAMTILLLGAGAVGASCALLVFTCWLLGAVVRRWHDLGPTAVVVDASEAADAWVAGVERRPAWVARLGGVAALAFGVAVGVPPVRATREGGTATLPLLPVAIFLALIGGGCALLGVAGVTYFVFTVARWVATWAPAPAPGR